MTPPSRKPTLFEAEVMLREAIARGHVCAVHEWRIRHDRKRHSTVIYRCECGNVSFDDVSCAVCRTFATMLVGRDESVEDLDMRYQLAERTLDRLATVVARLKEQQSAAKAPPPVDDIVITTGCEAVHPDRRGGQHVAMACTGVRVTHTPTGISVLADHERSQHANRREAFRQLRDKLMSREDEGIVIGDDVIARINKEAWG